MGDPFPLISQFQVLGQRPCTKRLESDARKTSRGSLGTISGLLATPGVETKKMMAAAEGRLRQSGPVVRLLAWASPIRLSGRGGTPTLRRTLTTY